MYHVQISESEQRRCGVGNRLLLKKKHTWVMQEKESVQERSVTQTNNK